jgi:hypothetical protein
MPLRANNGCLTDGKSRMSPRIGRQTGQRIAYVGTARNGKDFDLYVQEGAAANASPGNAAARSQVAA